MLRERLLNSEALPSDSTCVPEAEHGKLYIKNTNLVKHYTVKPTTIENWVRNLRLALLNWFKPSSKMFLLTVPRRYFFVDISCYFCCVFVMLSCASVYCCLVVTCWETADLLALVCDVILGVCYFPFGILGQVWQLIISIPDIFPLSYLFTIKTSEFEQVLSKSTMIELVRHPFCRTINVVAHFYMYITFDYLFELAGNRKLSSES